MMEFMRAGGVGIWIVTLFGLLALFGAGRFAWRADPDRLRGVVALTWATVFAIASAVSANLASVCWKVPNRPEWAQSPEMPLIVMTGIAESLTPAILGFTVLGVVWLLVAVGHRRLDAATFA